MVVEEAMVIGQQSISSWSGEASYDLEDDLHSKVSWE